MEHGLGEQRYRETISEVASILAKGYLRYQKTRRPESNDDVVDTSNSAALTENRLDCSSDRSNHSEPV